jgi:drug/metabolite transporter (DMT)-like permease
MKPGSSALRSTGETRPMDSKATSLMLVICSIWGFQQIAIKSAAPDIAPLMQLSVRSGVSILLVLIMLTVTKERFTLRDGTLLPGLFAGFLFAAEYLLIGEGLKLTSASHIIVFLYTAPVFAALGLHVHLPSERLNKLQWFGILIAFSGIITAFYAHGVAINKSVLIGDIMGLGAGFAWGATTVIIRCSNLAYAPASKTLLYQLAGAFVLLMLGAIISKQTTFQLTTVSVSSLIFQVLVVSFGSLFTWFWLLRNYSASRLGVLSFMTPIFGVLFGVWFLDETLTTNFIIGGVLVITGILTVSGSEFLEHTAKKIFWRL